MSDTAPLDRVRVAGVQRATAQQSYDDADAAFVDAIIAANDSGLSYRTIAEAAGLTFQRIAQIVTENR